MTSFQLNYLQIEQKINVELKTSKQLGPKKTPPNMGQRDRSTPWLNLTQILGVVLHQ